MNRVRAVAIALVIWGTGLIALFTIVTQPQELNTLREVTTLGTFVTFLVLANFCMSWSRVTQELESLDVRRSVKRAGLDLFLAGLLALVSQGLLWLALILKPGAPALVPAVVAMHGLILAFAWVLAWFPLRRILRLVQPEAHQRGDGR